MNSSDPSDQLKATRVNAMHGTESVSAWVARWAPLVAEQAHVLDLACGAGRHTLHFLQRGCRVTSVDLAAHALQAIAEQLSDEQATRSHLLCADLENAAWPLAEAAFDAIVVTHYLWRPRWPDLMRSLKPDGLLIYETFSQGHETIGKPSRPDFVLRDAELLDLAQRFELRVIAYESGFLSAPDRFIQRMVAAAPSGGPQNGSIGLVPRRFPLNPA
jgi:SAM-dependent methyltransferase